MNVGKTLFAQVTKYVPRKTFGHIINRYCGDAGVRTLDCAVSTYVLIAIVKKEFHLNASLYTLLQILSISVFEKTLISCTLQPDTDGTVTPPPSNQMILLDF